MRASKKSGSREYAAIPFKNGFREGKNVWFGDEGIACRPGITPTADPIVFTPWEFATSFLEFKITDLTVIIDGVKKRIAVCAEDDGHSNICYHIFALTAESRQPLGTIIFSRASSENFFTPASYIIFDGKPARGSGLFFLTRLVSDNEPNYTRIYELSKDMTYWMPLIDSEFYVPTLLINGHGFSAAKAESEGVRLSSPEEPESMNLIGERYRAFFTTDGYSHLFTMPKYPLVGRIDCELFLDTGEVVKWTIPADKQESELIDVDGVPMKLRCIRKTGQILTDSSQKACVPLPFYGAQSNLRFSLAVDNTESALLVFSFTKSRKIFATADSQSSAVAVFSGNSLDPNIIAWSSPLVPLYFPEKNCISLPTPVTRLGITGDRLLIFEKYSVTSAKASIKAPLLEGYLPQIILAADKKCELSRSIIADTAVETDDKLIFYSNDGTVFSIDSRLNLKALAKTDTEPPEIGAMLGDRYLLIKGSAVTVLDTSVDRFFHWELPAEILSAANYEGKAVFYADNGGGEIFGFTLFGDCDSYFLMEKSNRRLVTEPIEACFTALLTDISRCCKLHELSVDANSDSISAELFADNKLLTRLSTSNRHRLFPSALFHKLYGRFSFSGGTELYKAELKYSKFSKL